MFETQILEELYKKLSELQQLEDELETALGGSRAKTIII